MWGGEFDYDRNSWNLFLSDDQEWKLKKISFINSKYFKIYFNRDMEHI